MTDNNQQQHDTRLLLAALDGNEPNLDEHGFDQVYNRINQILSEEPNNITPQMRGHILWAALDIAEALRTDLGTDAARAALQDALLTLQMEAEADRDPVGTTWFSLNLSDV